MNRVYSLLVGVGLALVSGCAAFSPDGRVRDSLPLARERIAVPPNAVVDVYWKLVELNGEPAPLGSGGKEAHLLLQVNKPIVRGFGGCNRFSGAYWLEGDQLAFEGLVSTKIACKEGMPLEADYLTALETVARWSREGGDLLLFDKDGRTVARFMAREL